MTLDTVHKRLLDNLNISVLLLDYELSLLYINPAAENLLEISDRKARQLSIADVFIEAAEDIAEMQAALASHSSFTRRKAEFLLSHGKVITVDYSINTFEENGQIQALLELNSLEHVNRISREQNLSSAHATAVELVRGLAHEIKNPLGGIRGAAQLLSQELPTAELREYTNVIIEEADRLHKLVDRLVGSRHPPELKDINIHEVLERVRNLVEAEIVGKSIRLITDYDPSIPPLHADAEQLIQAMLNIVRNAMQSLTSPVVNHDLGRIYLRTRIIRNATIGSSFHRLAASIKIIDNGPGVDSEIIDTIFYPMISGRADGTGLGLSIAHGIISQHKGMIECICRPGVTCFKVVLPVSDSNLGH
ncbi:MAG TPA: PAS domain-containing sensor histidine kinase [Gammaproteobacteria bacterium]|nr:PAS domain-containing sensor histidine kinase [Gammaproteobacteria bacterium]HIF88071.1 PAS domain-containing sensor histidine kinase [Gammaproteobacteria bacterium]HIL63479.1 PAS domain-containing sensor histidine kinase [Porticoccaceae bacterium]HIN90575.1 PAS domain-containing sensor histidine kinase [Porticoccaceae bacterium]